MPPSEHPSLWLSVQAGSFFILQLPHNKAVPPWILEELAGSDSSFFSITRSAEEISVVGKCRSRSPEDVQKLSTWSCIKILGPMEHNLTGILADFSQPLKAVKVPIFAISTWNTDYILVPKDRLLTATSALRDDGWIFVQ